MKFELNAMKKAYTLTAAQPYTILHVSSLPVGYEYRTKRHFLR